MRNRLLLGSLFQNMYKFSYLSSCFTGTSNDEEKLVQNDDIKRVSYFSTWGHFDFWALKVAHDNASVTTVLYIVILSLDVIFILLFFSFSLKTYHWYLEFDVIIAAAHPDLKAIPCILFNGH